MSNELTNDEQCTFTPKGQDQAVAMIAAVRAGHRRLDGPKEIQNAARFLVKRNLAFGMGEDAVCLVLVMARDLVTFTPKSPLALRIEEAAGSPLVTEMRRRSLKAAEGRSPCDCAEPDLWGPYDYCARCGGLWKGGGRPSGNGFFSPADMENIRQELIAQGRDDDVDGAVGRLAEEGFLEDLGDGYYRIPEDWRTRVALAERES